MSCLVVDGVVEMAIISNGLVISLYGVRTYDEAYPRHIGTTGGMQQETLHAKPKKLRLIGRMHRIAG